jgi:hypothetical protein
MSLSLFLNELRQRGVVLTLNGPYLHVDAPADSLTPELRFLLIKHKASVRWALANAVRCPDCPSLCLPVVIDPTRFGYPPGTRLFHCVQPTCGQVVRKED